MDTKWDRIPSCCRLYRLPCPHALDKTIYTYTLMRHVIIIHQTRRMDAFGARITLGIDCASAEKRRGAFITNDIHRLLCPPAVSLSVCGFDG
jgi:hypothetical protein